MVKNEDPFKKRLGTSQKAIIEWLKEHPQSTVSEIGEACYKASYYGKQECYAMDPKYKIFRSRWASRILQNLKKAGIADFSDINNPKWFIVEVIV